MAAASHQTSPAPARTLSSRGMAVLFAAFAVFHVYTSLLGTFDPLIQRGIFIGGGVAFAFWIYHTGKGRFPAFATAFEVALAVAGLYGGFHAAFNHERLMDVMNDLTLFDEVVAAVTLLAILESARRAIGWSLPLMAVAALLYYFWGNQWLGGAWRPPPLSLETGLETLYASTNGVFGFMADIGTRVIAIYVVFGSILMATGAGEVFMRAAALIAGRTYGGPAKVAVITSALFGMVSGSAVANVMSVGTITIPTMVRAGYRKSFAAGVEASASAGGQIMPPVMGAGAFIMAELLNVSYVSIAIAAAIPAILYFAAIYFSVDLFARRHGLQPMSREEMPRLASVIASRDTIPAFGSLIVLAWLLFDNYTPTLAGAVATMALIGLAAATRVVIALAEKRAGQIAGEFRRLGAEIWAGLVDGGRSLVMIATLLACAAILVTILNASGLGVKVSNLLLGLSSEAVLPVLIISAVLCILLGMDVPTTASYLLTAAVSGPLLVKLGVPPLTAHLFIFYFAILSALTPPVCASVYAAATLIGENFWKVAGQALRIAGGVYFIPFMFVYRQSLLFQGSATSIAYDLAITTLAIFSMSAASIGYFFGRVGWMERALLYVAAAMFFITPVWSDAVGAALIIGLGAWQVLVRGPAAAKAVAG